MQDTAPDLVTQDTKHEIKDSTVTIQELKNQMAQFVRDRDWGQFHNPKNLSMAIAAEAAELLEKFLWLDGTASHSELEKNRQEIEDELADIVIAALMFANSAKIDVARAIAYKMQEIAAKYPVEKAKGKCDKYTNLE
jgi:dCTP diphosphatase